MKKGSFKALAETGFFYAFIPLVGSAFIADNLMDYTSRRMEKKPFAKVLWMIVNWGLILVNAAGVLVALVWGVLPMTIMRQFLSLPAGISPVSSTTVWPSLAIIVAGVVCYLLAGLLISLRVCFLSKKMKLAS